MSNSGWKKYGGISHFESQNNISVYSLSVDLFTLRQSYFGTFDICGELHTSGDAFIDQTLEAGNLTVFHDSCLNEVVVVGNTQHIGNVDISNNLTVQHGNLYVVDGNVDLSQNLFLRKKLYLGNSGVYVNATDTVGNIGINTIAPISAVDIRTVQPFALNVASSTSQNYSVLSRTTDQNGVVLYTDASQCRLDMYVDGNLSTTGLPSATPDARISYTQGGNLAIDVSNNIALLGNVVVVSSSNNSNTSHVTNETMVVYENATGDYEALSYEGNVKQRGDGITVKGAELTFSNWLTTTSGNNKGMSVGGGIYPLDTSRAMGTLGLQRSSTDYAPAINVVAGSSNLHNKTTVALHTATPTVDTYGFQVNAPTKLTNGQITSTLLPMAELYDIEVCRSNPDYAIAVGSPLNTTQPYNQQIYYTTNRGETWQTSAVGGAEDVINTNPLQKIQSVYLVDASLSFILAENSLFYSFDSGAHWNAVGNIPFSNYHRVFATSFTPRGGGRVFFSCVDASQQPLLAWFDYSGNIYGDIDGIVYGDVSGGTAGTLDLLNISDGGSITSPQYPYDHFKIDGSGADMFVCGQGQGEGGPNTRIKFIRYFNNANTANGSSISQIGTPVDTHVFLNYPSDASNAFRDIHMVNASKAIAISPSFYTYTNTGNTGWTTVNNNTYYNANSNSWQSVCFVDDSVTQQNALLVGDNGALAYANDNGSTTVTWKVVPSSLLNTGGDVTSSSLSSTWPLKKVRAADTTQFYVIQTRQSYNGNVQLGNVQLGNSRVMHCYLPNLFTNATNYILDASGSVRVSGDVQINDGGKLRSTASSFYAWTDSVTDLHLGTTGVNSNTTIQSNLIVSQDASMQGNVVVADGKRLVSRIIDNTQGNCNIEIGNLKNASLGNVNTRSIYLGCFGDTDVSNNIYIGGPGDVVTIGGSVQTATTLKIGPAVYVNYAALANSSPDTGIFFGENGVKNAGKFTISNNRGGFTMRSTLSANNVFLDTSGLTFSASPTEPTLNNRLITLSAMDAGNANGNFRVGVVDSLDASSLFVRNYTYTNAAMSSLYNTQIVDTSCTVLGNLGIGTATTGVLTAGYRLDVSGNTNVRGNLTVGSNIAVTSGLLSAPSVAINRTSVTSGYVVDVTGNANVSGNVVLGNGLTVSAGGITASATQTITFGTNAPTMNGNNIASATIPLTSLATGIMTTGNVAINKTSVTNGFALDVSGAMRVTNGLTVVAGTISLPNASIADAALSTNVALLNSSSQTFSGTRTFTGGITATGAQTITFGTNAPTMNGNNIATNTIPVAAINGLSTALAGINSTGNVAINQSSVTAGYVLDVSGNTRVTGNLVVSAGMTISGGLATFSPSFLHMNTVPTSAYDNGTYHSGSPSLKISNSAYGTTAATTGYSNILFGFNVLNNATNSTNRTIAIGSNCLPLCSGGDQSIAIGNDVMPSVTTSSVNVGIGSYTMYQMTSGTYNIGIGNAALTVCVTGSYNIAIGSSALSGGYASNATGCTSIGYFALANLGLNGSGRDKSNNTAVGYNALNGAGGGYNNVNYLDGANNTAMGSLAGAKLSGASDNCTFLGATCDVSSLSSTYMNSTGIGYGCVVDASNTIVLGRSTETTRCWAMDVRGTATFTGGITATGTQTITFGTNAPTMNGNNLATNTIPWAAMVGGGVNYTGNVAINKTSVTAGYALDVSGNTLVAGNITITNGLTASAAQTITFGTNAPTMNGNNIAINTIPLTSLATGIMTTGSVAINKSSATANYQLDVSGNVLTSGNIVSNGGFIQIINKPLFVTGNGGAHFFKFADSTTGIDGVEVSGFAGGALTSGTTTNPSFTTKGNVILQWTTAGVAINKQTVTAGFSLDVSGALRATNGLTVVAGTVSFPAASISASAISGLPSATIAGINSTGNVAINKSSAAANKQLDVSGNVAVSGNLFVSNTGILSGDGGFGAESVNIAGLYSTNVSGFRITGDQYGTNTIYLNNNRSVGGNVNINAGSASSHLFLDAGSFALLGNGTSTGLCFRDANSTINSKLWDNSGNQFAYWTKTRHTFAVGGTGTSMTAAPTGAATLLDMSGTTVSVPFNLTVGTAFTVSNGATVTFPAGSISPSAINGGVSGSITGINSTGNVAINKTTVTAGYALDVNGNVQATSYNATSDRRLKENIAPLFSSSSSSSSSITRQIFEDLCPVSFTWKDHPQFPQRKQREDVGFIAQDVFRVLPHLHPEFAEKGEEPVDPETQEPVFYAMDYSKLTPHLWAGVRELYEENATRKKENTELKQQITSLESRLQRLEQLLLSSSLS